MKIEGRWDAREMKRGKEKKERKEKGKMRFVLLGPEKVEERVRETPKRTLFKDRRQV